MLLQTVSTIFSAMDVHGWLTFNEFVQVVEVRCCATEPARCTFHKLCTPTTAYPSNHA